MPVARAFGKSSAEKAQRELDRLAALERFDLMDTPRDEGFERIVRLIKDILTVDIGIVSLIDAHRQWYKSCSGLTVDEVPTGDTFCRLVVESEQPVIIEDASKDPRVANHPMVTGEPHIRFYAGVPIKTGDGHVLGTICAIDMRPHSFSRRDLAIMEELAGVAIDRIELMQSAATDSLTGALTRRAFKAEADNLIALSLRHKHDLSCILLDIDHFKKVNDTYGHAAGDEVLKTVTNICRQALRAGDLLGRLGGEEFAIVLPHVDREGVITVAEKLRGLIAAGVTSGPFGQLSVTASLGLTTVSIVGRDIETLLAQADAAMYRAKHEGRNRCLSWGCMPSDQTVGSRRRVLKSGSIVFNNRRSTVDCTVKSLGNDSAGLCVSNSAGIPEEFLLLIPGDGFETSCKVIAQDRQNLEVAFR